MAGIVVILTTLNSLKAQPLTGITIDKKVLQSSYLYCK